MTWALNKKERTWYFRLRRQGNDVHVLDDLGRAGNDAVPIATQQIRIHLDVMNLLLFGGGVEANDDQFFRRIHFHAPDVIPSGLRRNATANVQMILQILLHRLRSSGDAVGQSDEFLHVGTGDETFPQRALDRESILEGSQSRDVVFAL